jgi:hypothetical protein
VSEILYRELLISSLLFRDCSSPQGREPHGTKRRSYDVNAREDRLGVPILKKYLPQYQTSGLIDELKEHDKMRLIQEKEAKRWMAICASRGTDSSSDIGSADQTSYEASTMPHVCDTRESVSGSI